MTTAQYLSRLNTLYHTGTATEHSYRGDLQNLIMELVPDILVTNEPTRVSCGAPDYVLTRKEVPVGYIEAKDVGIDLNSKSLKEQFDRYKAGLSNLIITDYLHFQFFKEGEFITEIRIGEVGDGEIKPIQESFLEFEHLVQNFALTVSQSIKSPTRLAKMMAGKARLMADVIEKSLNSDDTNDRRTSLKNQMIGFRDMLIHDINNKTFADIYAQTIAYGMFAARYHDPTLKTFSRIEAAQLIPKSNPFLRKFFQDIAGFDLDNRLVWIVEELVSVFLASDVAKIMKNFGKTTKQEDPVVHFYETFLGEYSHSLKVERGVWYTPQPVVNFIVRSVDDILKQEFNLPHGLADSTKTTITVKVPTNDRRSPSGLKDHEKEVHRVQILDPATGTGTFLSEVVKHIHKKFEGQQGIWSKYVNENLIPRLNGFELLMASYAMAHLQMDVLLTETGYRPQDDQRFRIFLTNSLEEAHPDTGTLFSILSDEANQANAVKRDTPVMVIMGNPPYNKTSKNSNPYINNLLEAYKRGLNERNLVPLENDYVKFIRLGENFIAKNNSGVLAYISANSFLDGVTHRLMRQRLRETFDKIYILNLHGNTKKKEVSPDGSADENVFDIMTGVSINIFIKTKNEGSKLADICYLDLYGKRKVKYKYLAEKDFRKIEWTKLNIDSQDPWRITEGSSEEYNSFIPVTELFRNTSPCIRTHNDPKLISFTPFSSQFNQAYLYKAFDYRYVDYDLSKIGRSRIKVMQEFLSQENVGLIFQRGSSAEVPNTPFITKALADQGAIKPGTTSTSTIAPLYLYSESLGDEFFETRERTPNLNQELVDQIAEGINHTFLPDENLVADLEPGVEGSFSPLDILDYIYAVLHSPNYREAYKEFLNIDFPRVPYPDNAAKFWQLVELGRQLREIHLLESPMVENYITGYPKDGDNVVRRKITKTSPGYEAIDETLGRVWINDQQYFDKVPLEAWEFYIGGYQPAQKWLKDRRERELSYDDILHYQKIIVALSETARIMIEIDKVELIKSQVDVSPVGS